MATYNIHIPPQPNHPPSVNDGEVVANALNIAQTIAVSVAAISLFGMLVFCLVQFGVGALFMFFAGLIAFVIVGLPLIFIGSMIVGLVCAALTALTSKN